MADNAAKVATMARVLAIVHIIVGTLLVCLGTADLLVAVFWTGYGGFGIWTGFWMCVAGGLGIPGTRSERSTSRNAFAGVFMGFSITSAVFGGIIIICYSTSIAINQDYYGDDYYYDPDSYNRRHYDDEMALTVIILISGIVEFAIGIWAAVCLCLMKPCTCCYGNPPQQGQDLYTVMPGSFMSQAPGGVPVAVPIQAGCGMAAVQTGMQGGQPQTVLVPASGVVRNQGQFVQVPPTRAMATDRQLAEMPPSYGQGKYMPLKTEQ